MLNSSAFLEVEKTIGSENQLRKQWWNTSLIALVGCFIVSAPIFAGETAKKEAGDPALAIKYDDKDLVWGACPAIFQQDHTCRVTVLHGDPARENVDIFFKLAPNAALVHHKHTSAERMVLVSGKLRVAYDGQEPAVLVPGTYAYGPPELPHSAECIGSEDCVLFIAFEEPVDAIAVSAGNH